MKYEQRVIKASAAAGATELLIGLVASVTGFHEWYFEHFHFFGVLGVGMLLYAAYHEYYRRRDSR
jgi:hypothetical protein